MHGTGQRIARDGPHEDDGAAVLWFEVEDFLRYFDHFRNPTGMQRVPFEIFVEAERLYGGSGRVRFCRLSVYTKQFEPVGFDAIISAYLNPPGASAPWKTIWEPGRFWTDRWSGRLLLIMRHLRFFLRISRTAVRDLVRMIFRRSRFGRSVRLGDIVVSLGASWGFPGYFEHVAEGKRRYGIRFSALIYDLIPIESPFLVEERHAIQFRKWLHDAILHADILLAISRHSRDALRELTRSVGRSTPPVEVLELGTGLSDRPATDPQKAIALPHRYVLFVSTLEIRKNHRLLFRVWRRLLERYPADAVPVLLFAGQIGWKVDDLLAELAASKYMGGKIELMPALSDGELRQAYRSCLFTVFPSLCEGWGLPIAESLALGKFCVASDRTSIPEVGGDLVDYFDPTDDDDALTKIERLLFNPGYLAAREARIRAEYRPRTWADCAHSLVGKLAQTAARGVR
jgi:glycosyltransferase involved in cell wall biosynthesis